jgi:hypothetical protein
MLQAKMGRGDNLRGERARACTLRVNCYHNERLGHALAHYVYYER